MSGFTRSIGWVLRGVIGLLLASLCSSVVLSFYVATAPDPPLIGPQAVGVQGPLFLFGIFFLYPFVLGWTLVTFLFLGAPTISLFQMKKVTHWLAFALGGSFVAATSWLVARGLEVARRSPRNIDSDRFFTVELLMVFVISGFMSGLIYWLFVHAKPAAVSAVTSDKSE